MPQVDTMLIAVTYGVAFIASIEHPHQNIDARLNKERLQNIQENRYILKFCVESILFCGHQCIALRGDAEKLDMPVNPGNFLAMVRLLSNHDPILKAHLEKPRLRNATYMSPDVQNQIIDVIGKQIIQKDLVNEIIHAEYYSIMIDEVTSHNQELMPLCIRFVDSNHNIREEFCSFPL